MTTKDYLLWALVVLVFAVVLWVTCRRNELDTDDEIHDFNANIMGDDDD